VWGTACRGYLGHEFCGEVVELGEGVEGWSLLATVPHVVASGGAVGNAVLSEQATLAGKKVKIRAGMFIHLQLGASTEWRTLAMKCWRSWPAQLHQIPKRPTALD